MKARAATAFLIAACAAAAAGAAPGAQTPGPAQGGGGAAAGRGAGQGRGAPPAEGTAPPAANADGVPNLQGVWDGGARARPVNGVDVPWVKGKNFPELNERGLAYMKIFDEAVAPKYDCQPSTSPAIQYDPYAMSVVQWPDRVLFRYEKDDQLRTVWLDGRKAAGHEFSLQGHSVGTYEKGALLVETTKFAFDITGFDDYNGIPSSSQKKVLERYWREGNELRVTVTVEDPMFLRKPTSYTTRWLPTPPGYVLAPFDCDPESSRAPLKLLPQRYK